MLCSPFLFQNKIIILGVLVWDYSFSACKEEVWMTRPPSLSVKVFV